MQFNTKAQREIEKHRFFKSIKQEAINSKSNFSLITNH